MVDPVFCYGNHVLVRSVWGMFLSIDSGNHWKIVDSSNGIKNVIKIVSKDSMLFAGSITGGIYASTDSGKTWNAPKAWTFINDLADLTASGDNIVCSFQSNDKIYVSKDNGQSWDSATKGLTPVLHHYDLPGDYVNIENKTLVCYENKLYETYDHGETWNYTSNSVPNIQSYSILNFHDRIFTGNDRIYESIDSGANWQTKYILKNGLSRITGICSNGKLLFASTAYGDEGVLMSIDSGGNWMSVNVGLSTLNFYSISMDSSYVYIGAEKGQVFRRSIGEVTGQAVVKTMDIDLFHLKVYPNPFQHTATFEFGRELQKGSIVVYDLIGNEVARVKDINNNRYEFQRGDMSSGTYMYVLTEGNKKLATGKLIIE